MLFFENCFSSKGVLYGRGGGGGGEAVFLPAALHIVERDTDRKKFERDTDRR